MIRVFVLTLTFGCLKPTVPIPANGSNVPWFVQPSQSHETDKTKTSTGTTVAAGLGSAGRMCALSPRQYHRIGLGLLALFLVLYLVSLFLPAWVEYAVSNSRGVATAGELARELEKGSHCRTTDGARDLTRDATPSGPLPQDSVCVPVSAWRGLEVLLLGWLALLIPNFAWAANPLALSAVILRVHAPAKAFGPALGAVLLGFDAFRFDEPSMGAMAPPPRIDHLASGYWVWEFSFVVLFLACLAAFREAQCSRSPPEWSALN
jgi:hypothetical protein